MSQIIILLLVGIVAGFLNVLAGGGSLLALPILILALAIFIAHGQVNYTMGFSLAAGNSFGGWIATHVAVKKGHNWIKNFVSITVFVFAVKLFLE